MNKGITLFLLSSFLVSCNLSGEDVYMQSLNGNWEKQNSQKFDFEIKDAESAKNIIFVVRNNNNYPYSNIRFFSTLYPKGEQAQKTDTLNYILAKPNGEWIGSGFGDTKETLFQYKLNYKFPKNGTYTIEVQHAMRRDTLKGVEDFGIMIEPAKP
ncbi:MAG: gliding motility lipoprotein GldH [Cruoricaptor ignavus]|nr:gliding motility lipoprotein GldH [Cruoricaptor ignavus]